MISKTWAHSFSLSVIYRYGPSVIRLTELKQHWTNICSMHRLSARKKKNNPYKEPPCKQNRSSLISNHMTQRPVTPRQIQCESECRRHILSIRPQFHVKLHTSHSVPAVETKYCPPGKTIPRLNKSFSLEPQIPMFLVPEEVEMHAHYLQVSRREFRQAKKKSLLVDDAEDTPIMRPYPKSTYCQICKARLASPSGYYEHVESSNHALSLRRSLGEHLIQEEIAKWERKRDEMAEGRRQAEQLNREIKEVAGIYRGTKRALKAILLQMIKTGKAVS